MYFLYSKYDVSKKIRCVCLEVYNPVICDQKSKCFDVFQTKNINVCIDFIRMWIEKGKYHNRYTQIVEAPDTDIVYTDCVRDSFFFFFIMKKN